MKETTAFLDMGGYAAFVWPSLVVTLVIMAGLLVATLRQLHSRQRRLAELEARGAQRQRRQRPAQEEPAAREQSPQPDAGPREARP
ncbi:heme exporter protein CcmD [Pelagibius sp. CAU 1746]|uniref:heme exporter protein CcmD n=1 Tax=Pelagibius sp. CAU 1746 TaxID=3140370 RepID=UPI00325B35B8